MTANLYVNNPTINRDLKTLMRQGADSIGICEGYSFIEELKEIEGYRLIHAKPSGRGPQDVPILISEEMKILDQGSIRACNPSTPLKIAPARWITWVEFKKDDTKWVHFNTHCHAALQDRDNGRIMDELDRVKEAQKHMVKLEEMIEARRKNGFKVLVTGDFNYRTYNDRKFKLWKHSPQLTFRRCQMNFANAGVDYIGYSGGFERTMFTSVGTDKTGSDHPWLVLTLRRRKAQDGKEQG